MTNTLDKVRDARIGHDTLGPTGLTIHLTSAERDEIIAALTAMPYCHELMILLAGRPW